MNYGEGDQGVVTRRFDIRLMMMRLERVDEMTEKVNGSEDWG